MKIAHKNGSGNNSYRNYRWTNYPCPGVKGPTFWQVVHLVMIPAGTTHQSPLHLADQDGGGGGIGKVVTALTEEGICCSDGNSLKPLANRPWPPVSPSVSLFTSPSPNLCRWTICRSELRHAASLSPHTFQGRFWPPQTSWSCFFAKSTQRMSNQSSCTQHDEQIPALLLRRYASHVDSCILNFTSAYA